MWDAPQISGNSKYFMIMIRFKDIQIPKPCSVEYDLLPGNETKRFCGSCEKHVYDFRDKDETYLNQIFQETGKVCGIYYADQIQPSSLNTKRSFYYTLAAKFIGAGLFFKSLFSMQDVHASTTTSFPPTTEQEPITKNGVKVQVKDHNSRIDFYQIEISINDSLYTYVLNQEDSIIHLPDHVQPEDNIKIIIRKSKKKLNYSVIKTKGKKYSFKYKNAETITIQINSNRHLKLFKRRRPQIMGKLRAM